ncbi:MAG: hypothetical protein ACYDAZ_00650 [Thermoplasmataceae archaeon]
MIFSKKSRPVVQEPDWRCPACGVSFVPYPEETRDKIFQNHVKGCAVPGGRR